MIINSKCIKTNAVCSYNLLKLFRLLPQMDPGETSQNAPSLIQTFSFNIRESFVRSPSFSILPLFGMSGLASELGVAISTWTRILVSTLPPLTIFFIYCAEICWPKFFSGLHLLACSLFSESLDSPFGPNFYFILYIQLMS